MAPTKVQGQGIFVPHDQIIYTYGPVLGQSGFAKTTNSSRVLFKCIANQLHIDQMFILFLFLIIYCFLHVISNWGG